MSHTVITKKVQFTYPLGGTDEGQISLEPHFSRLRFTVDINEFELQGLMDAIILHFRDEVIEHINRTRHVDCLTFEGGIDSGWFGLGSVTLYELSLRVNFEYSDGPVIVTMR